MRGLWAALLLGIVALVLLVPAPAAAEKFNAFSETELEEHGWEPRTHNEGFFGTGAEVTLWCKTATNFTNDDGDTFSVNKESLQSAINDHAGILSRGIPQGSLDGIVEKDTDYVMLCVNPEQSEPGEKFLCVHRNADLPPIHSFGSGKIIALGAKCWDSSGELNQGWLADAGEAVTNPVGAAVDSTIGRWMTELNQGVRWFLAVLLYWWILIPSVDVEKSTAAVMWPPMLGLGMGIGIFLLVWQGVKMMFSGKAPLILADTLKGLAYFALWCILGITFIGTLTKASEGLTYGILNYSLDAAEIGCSRYQAEERQPDGFDITFPDVDTSNMTDEESERAATQAEVGKAFGTCAASQMAVTVASSAWLLLFYIIAFIVSLVQGLLLFIREAALPVMALLLPIAAAGQIGGSNTKRWLPNLVTMMMTLLAYKPMVALVFAVGFTSSTLSDNVMDILRGLLTLLVGVIAPAVLLKAFKPIATQGIEELGSLSSTANQVLQARQFGGAINQWMEKRGGQRAAQAAQSRAAAQAAQQGGGLMLGATKAGAQAAGTQAASTGAAAAAGPVGWAAKAGQALKSGVKFVLGKSEGIKPEDAARSGRLAQHLAGDPGSPPGAPGGHAGLQVRESGSTPYGPSSTPPVSSTPSERQVPVPHAEQGSAGVAEAPAPPPDHAGHPRPAPVHDPGPATPPSAGGGTASEAPPPPVPPSKLPPAPSNSEHKE